MDKNAPANEIRTANYLKALNVQNALGYRATGWREYENALGKSLKPWMGSPAYVSSQCLLASLGELLS